MADGFDAAHASVAAALEHALELRKLSLRQLSRLLAPDEPERARRNLNRWKSGGGVSRESAERLATVLDVPVEWFYRPAGLREERERALEERVALLERRLEAAEKTGARLSRDLRKAIEALDARVDTLLQQPRRRAAKR